MNIEEIKMDHFENFEELIRTCKTWIIDDDIDAYYRFFEFNCMKALVTAYEKEKEKNKEKDKFEKILADDLKRHIESITIGKSITFPCGWVSKQDLLNLIDDIEWK